MKFSITAPARINILGNPADANEGDFATISATIDLYAGAVFESSDTFILDLLPEGAINKTPGQNPECSFEFSADQLPLDITPELNLIKGAFNQLYAYSEEFRYKVQHQAVRISSWTEVPRQSGLGGSSLFAAMTLSGLCRFYNLDPDVHNAYVLAEITQRVEHLELRITCGFADRYMPFFSGLAYLDYRGKLHQKVLFDEPYVTHESLNPWAHRLSLLAASTGVKHNSGDVHGPMRSRYLEEHDTWVRNGGETPPMLRFMGGAWETAWRGKIALLHNDLTEFGRQMNINHSLVNQMMTYCGFEGGAGEANNLLINSALQNGALGAKLTGAGQGGSVFALVSPGDESLLLEVWERTVEQAGLKDAYIYQPHIVLDGITFLEED